MNNLSLRAALLCGAVSFGTGSAFAQSNTFPSSGNVGVGTTSPFAKLDVEGKVNIGTGTAQNMFLSTESQLQIFTDFGVPAQLSFWQNGASLSYLGHRASDNRLFLTNAWDGSSLGTAGRSISLDSIGNVGIGNGTDTSAFRLDVRNDNFNAIRAYGISSNSIGIYVGNQVASGRQYALLSSGGGPSPLGSFTIWDDTAAERIWML